MASARSTAVEAVSLVAAVDFLDLGIAVGMLASLADACQNVQQCGTPTYYSEAFDVPYNEFLFNISNNQDISLDSTTSPSYHNAERLFDILNKREKHEASSGARQRAGIAGMEVQKR